MDNDDDDECNDERITTMFMKMDMSLQVRPSEAGGRKRLLEVELL